MRWLFISDLHLDPKRTDIQDCFEQFIRSCLDGSAAEEQGSKIDALYILGDLFEVWIGDDASIPIYQKPIKQLKQLTDSGINVFVMHGNRDFLLGKNFEQASGCQLIPDLYHLTIHTPSHESSHKPSHEPSHKPSHKPESSQTILLSHGDIFCTDDSEYMQFRNMVRDPAWKKEFLAKSIPERISIARAMREQSKQLGKEKKAEITDVNQKTVEAIMSDHDVNTLIHGHTHRPAVHEFVLNNQVAKRIVLPDWTPDAEAFVVD